MSIWDTYPPHYRAHEVQAVVRAVQAGECVALVGLSGAGKSNLMGFLSHRSALAEGCESISALVGNTVLVDCNRLLEPGAAGLFRLVRLAIDPAAPGGGDEFAALEATVARRLERGHPLAILLDRFDGLPAGTGVLSGLRALRDAHKYELVYVIATRRPLDARSELAELFFAHTLWLGPLSRADAYWTVERYAARAGLAWDTATADALINLTGGYPSFLRAACEAWANLQANASGSGVLPMLAAIRSHPAVQRRLDEFWSDQPSPEALRSSRLDGSIPLLGGANLAETQLTAKEHLLLEYLRAHPQGVCEKDELIRAVWPEDRIFERGVRDDSLAQLVRRLREKIEPDPSNPRLIHTAPGRGYRYTP